jgi:hypothetical protein
VVKRHEDFGLRDKYGRVIGADVTTWEVTIESAPEDFGGDYSTLPAGHYFALGTRGTRDGKGFGPIKYTRYFTTVAEREVALLDYLGGAAKRAVKARGQVAELRELLSEGVELVKSADALTPIGVWCAKVKSLLQGGAQPWPRS